MADFCNKYLFNCCSDRKANSKSYEMKNLKKIIKKKCIVCNNKYYIKNLNRIHMNSYICNYCDDEMINVLTSQEESSCIYAY